MIPMGMVLTPTERESQTQNQEVSRGGEDELGTGRAPRLLDIPTAELRGRGHSCRPVWAPESREAPHGALLECPCTRDPHILPSVWRPGPRRGGQCRHRGQDYSALGAWEQECRVSREGDGQEKWAWTRRRHSWSCKPLPAQSSLPQLCDHGQLSSSPVTRNETHRGIRRIQKEDRCGSCVTAGDTPPGCFLSAVTSQGLPPPFPLLGTRDLGPSCCCCPVLGRLMAVPDGVQRL